jgi:hypothetical protein
MNKKLLKNRVIETLGLILIGDGMVGLFDTERHLRLWRRGPEAYQDAMEELEERPVATKILSAAEIWLGFWIVSQQKAAGNNRAEKR